MAPYLAKYEDDIDRRTKWWPSYPSVGFNERSQARQVLDEFVVDAFVQPRCLAKSASAVSLTFIRDAGDRTFQPLHRTTSYSDLSPSHALPYDSRVAPRIVNPNRSARVNYNKWYLGAYSPSYFRDTHTYAYDKFYRWKDHDAPSEKLARTWYHPGLLDRPQVWPLSTSYIKGSRSYMGRYVADRVRFDDHLLNYVHESYNRKPDARYLRYMTGQPGTFVGMPLALPRYQPSWHRYKIFKMTEKVII